MKKLKVAALGVGAVLAWHLTHSAAAPVAASGPVTSGSLVSDQQQFGTRFAGDTGLNPGVITAWLLAEESGSAAAGRQAAGNNDWLNIGYTDGGTYGAGDSIWANPVSAADATAGWMEGRDTVPGFGTAASGIRAIMATAGQSPSAQIAAIRNSGWASSGYPDLASLYQEAA